jgi:hypothetical protein
MTVVWHDGSKEKEKRAFPFFCAFMKTKRATLLLLLVIQDFSHSVLLLLLYTIGTKPTDKLLLRIYCLLLHCTLSNPSFLFGQHTCMMMTNLFI